MNDTCTYRIHIDGQVEEAEINAMSPHQTLAEPIGTATRLSITTDQAGLMGLLRHLHGLGFVLLSVQREPAQSKLRLEPAQGQAERSQPPPG